MQQNNERGWLLSIAKKFYRILHFLLHNQTNSFLPVNEGTFIADKAYDVKAIYNTVKDVYEGDCVIPLNKRNTKNPKKLPAGHPICEAGLAMNKDGKCRSEGRFRQKYCCPFRNSKSGCCPCNHKNRNNGKKNKGSTKYITLPDDYRLSIDRDCISFKKIYSLRTDCSRLALLCTYVYFLSHKFYISFSIPAFCSSLFKSNIHYITKK